MCFLSTNMHMIMNTRAFSLKKSLCFSFLYQVIRQQNNLSIVHPKAPQGFKDYLMVSCGYVLEGKKASTLSVPMVRTPLSYCQLSLTPGSIL